MNGLAKRVVGLAMVVAAGLVAGCMYEESHFAARQGGYDVERAAPSRPPAERRWEPAPESPPPPRVERRWEPSYEPPALAARSPIAPAPPKSHGGTANVNGAAYDAMFFRNYGTNSFIDSTEDHLSTFAMDVDTGSFTVCRSYLDRNVLPPAAAVRVEEFVNYFDYGYAPPQKRDEAMAIHAELAPSPFTAGKLLLRVGMKAREVDAADRKDAVLVFVIDTSGSMAQDGRLELVKKALHLLVDELDVGDRVGIVAFSTHARKVLHPCGLEDRDAILAAIDSLHPENTTNAQEGLELGYEMARKAFRKGAINRVILCSDGVANEGVTTAAGILAGVERAAKDGITLSTVGVGMGNYNDVLLEQLADKGHGNYAYVDRLAEARRIFSRNLTQTLQVVARDAKVQVDFNSDIVRSWRLVGYENRDVANKDFRNDKVGGGDVGAGHAVTALYELRLNAGKDGRLARIYVRYQPPDGGWAREVERNVTAADLVRRFSDTSDSFKLAVATAEFAEILRDSPWARRTALADVLAVAKECEANRASKNVHELVGLIEETRRLKADNRDSRDYSDEE